MICSGTLDESEKTRYTKLKQGLSALDSTNGGVTELVLIEPHESFNAFKDGDTIYISADQLKSGQYARSLVHEYTHFEFGTPEFNKLMELFKSDDILVDGDKGRIPLWQKAQELVFSKGYGFDKDQLNRIVDKQQRGKELTRAEAKVFEEFAEELSAHETELLLGTESFIDKLVSRDAPLAKRLITKISDLVKTFSFIKTPEARAELATLKKAQRLYLNAASKVGDVKLEKYINSRIDKEEDSEDIQSQGLGEKVDPNTTRYRRKVRYISYNKLGMPVVNAIKKQLRDIFGGLESSFADDIAIEIGNTVYIVDSGVEDGDISFGVRHSIKILDSTSKQDYIRRRNNDAIRKGYVDNGLSSKLGGGLDKDWIFDRRRSLGKKLSTDNGEPQHNPGGILEGNRAGGASGLEESLTSREGITQAVSQSDLWARLSKQERALLYKNISELHQQGYAKKKLKNGHYLFDVGDKILEVNDRFDRPFIVSLVEFDAKEKLQLMEEYFYDEINNGYSVEESVQFINILLGEEVAAYYQAEDGRGNSQVREQGQNTGSNRGNTENGANRRGVSGEFRDYLKEDIKLSLKATTERKMTDGEVKKLLANYTRKKVYSKKETEEIIHSVLAESMDFGDRYGDMSKKSEEEITNMLWKALNSANGPKAKMEVAEHIAQYIIKNAELISTFDDIEAEQAKEIVQVLKSYLHTLDLEGIKEDIGHRYGKHARALFARWQIEQGKRGQRKCG